MFWLIEYVVCKLMMISNLLLSKVSNSEWVVRVFTAHWTTVKTECSWTRFIAPIKSIRPQTSSLTYTNTASRHSNRIVLSWYDSQWVRNTDWSISRGWEGRLQAWHHADVHSESPLLAERSRGLSTFHFPQTGVCVCLSSIITPLGLPGTPPQLFCWYWLSCILYKDYRGFL